MTATNELFRRQGFNGTSLSQIVKAAQATTGSVYHFFPGGKDDLTAAVLRESGAVYGELVDLMIRDAIDPAIGMADAFAGAASVLASTDFIDPCPIGTIAREVANTHEPLRVVAAAVMDGWTEMMMAIFTDAGIGQDRALPLSNLAIAAIEGGFVLARTHRDVDAFLAVGEMLAAAIRAEMPAGQP